MLRTLLLILGLCACATAQAQTPVFTFECYCGFLDSTNCDICTPTVETRSFNGLLIKKNGVAYRWIDAPYTVRFFDSVATFVELIPNPDKVLIHLVQTPYDSLQQFKDSTFCACAIGGADDDGDPDNEAQTFSATGAGPTQYDLVVSDVGGVGGGTVTVAEGPGINITRSGNTITIEATGTTPTFTVSDGSNSEDLINQTLTFATTGIATVSYIPGANMMVIGAVEVDGDPGNELQTWGNAGTTSYTGTLSSSGGGFTLVASTGLSLSHAGGTITLTNTGDLSGTNEAQTLTAGGTSSPTVTLSQVSGVGGGTVTFAAGTNVTLNQSGGTITITATGDGAGYTTLEDAGVAVTQRATANFNATADIDWVLTDDGVETDVSADIPANAVEFSEMQDISSGVLMGRGTVGAGDPTQVTVSTGLVLSTGNVLTATDASVTNEAQTLSAGGTSSPTITLSTAGGAGGGTVTFAAGSNITLNQSGGTITITGTGGGGSITANNGLTMSTSTNVQWGGTLVQNTTIDNAGFYTLQKDGRFAFARYEDNPTGGGNADQAFNVTGIIANPSTSATPSEDAIWWMRGHSSGTPTVYSAQSLSMGIYPTTTNGVWMQSRGGDGYTTHYPIGLNPRGGKLVYGTVTPSDAQATFSASNLGTVGNTSLSGYVMQIQNSEGNQTAKLSWGVGPNFNDAGAGFFDAADALRLYNVNNLSSSSVRIGVGGETQEELMVTNAGIGAKVALPADIESTLQVNGSIAAAYLATVGAPTFDDTKFWVRYTGSTNQSYTLPTSSTCNGRLFFISNSSASSTITLSQSVSTGNGGNFTTITAGEHAVFISTGSGYFGFKLVSL